MKQELLDKYNVPVPRYTSYPPANYFHDGFTSRDYADAIRESNRQQPESVGFTDGIGFLLFSYSFLPTSLPLLRMQFLRRSQA